MNWARSADCSGEWSRSLARFSEAFLILRAEGSGLPLVLVPIVLMVMNAVYAVSAYPFGALSDKVDKRLILAGGFGVLIVADIVLAIVDPRIRRESPPLARAVGEQDVHRAGTLARVAFEVGDGSQGR